MSGYDINAESENEVFAAFKAGDRAAYDAIVRHITPLAIRICHRKLGAAGRYEHADAVQQVLLEALEALPRFEPAQGYRLLTFLGPRMQGACQDYMRKQLPPGTRRKHNEQFRRKTVHLDSLDDPDRRRIEEDVSDGDVFDEVMGWFEGSDMIDALAARCGDKQMRLVISLYFKNGLTLKQCAERLDLSESRCSQILSKALLRLKEMAEINEWDIENGQFNKTRSYVDVNTPQQPASTAPATIPARGPVTLTEAALSLIRANQSDLTELDQKIVDAENQLSALKNFRKFVAQRLGGGVVRQPKSGGGSERVGKLMGEMEDILKNQGSQTIDQLAQSIGRPKSQIAMSISKNPKVRRDGDLISLS